MYMYLEGFRIYNDFKSGQNLKTLYEILSCEEVSVYDQLCRVDGNVFLGGRVSRLVLE